MTKKHLIARKLEAAVGLLEGDVGIGSGKTVFFSLPLSVDETESIAVVV